MDDACGIPNRDQVGVFRVELEAFASARNCRLAGASDRVRDLGQMNIENLGYLLAIRQSFPELEDDSLDLGPRRGGRRSAWSRES